MMIGREYEKEELERLYNSEKPELVAIYGRRRVGKTYLVDTLFNSRITFRHAGLSPVEVNGSGALKEQLNQFYLSLQLQGMKKVKKPRSWLDAFFLLEMFLQEHDNGTRQVVFLDELPWMDTPRSGFITAFESFWNNWACHRNNVMVIVCGSANSWIRDKLINNHGGLYGRVTCEIKIEPFTLKECEEYLQSMDVRMSRYDIVQSYMILGGIPYYLNYFRKGLSLSQNISRMFFSRNAVLRDEYNRLFQSAFDSPELVQRIVEFLYKRSSGYTRAEILKELNISGTPEFTSALRSLLSADFVIKYVPFGKSKKNPYYRLTDPFCLFYLRFIKNNADLNESWWDDNQSSQAIISWRGYAFENVCFIHTRQIKNALGISGVVSQESGWICSNTDNSTQIDMLIIRKDNVINMCEIKYYNHEFSVDKQYYMRILSRESALQKVISPLQSIHSTLITTFGLTYNEYSGAFTNVITLNDLFA